MAHSLCRIWIHGILGTKNREKFILPKAEKPIYDLIKTEFESLDCPLRILNGTEDHVHVLFLLNKNHAIKSVFKQVKGAVSHAIKQKNLVPFKFSWQVGYGAFSVSENRVKHVEKYMKRQKEHYEKVSFQEELDGFFKLCEMEPTLKY